MIEPPRRETLLLRLDARPLDREAVALEPGIGKPRDVLRVAEHVIPRDAGRLNDAGVIRLFPVVPVVGVVAAFDLVRGGRRPPRERGPGPERRHLRPSTARSSSALFMFERPSIPSFLASL